MFKKNAFAFVLGREKQEKKVGKMIHDIHEIGPNFKLVLFNTFVRYVHCSMTQLGKCLYLSMYKHRDARVSRYVFAAIWYAFQDIFFLSNFSQVELTAPSTLFMVRALSGIQIDSGP